MKNTIKERLDYLKEVRRPEIAEKIRKAREQGDLANSKEYADARMEQALCEGEILELEDALKQEKKVSLKYTRKEDLLYKLRNDDFFKFFDNEDFLLKNYKKKYSTKEKVAIIVHSESQSLNTKIQALTDIKNISKNETLNKTIDLWIDYKKSILENFYQINDCNHVFVTVSKIRNLNDAYIPNVYKTLKDCLDVHSSKEIFIKNIEEDSLNKIGSYHRRTLLLTNDYDVCDVVDGVFEHPYKMLPVEQRLEYISIKLDNPFKPYDIIACSVYGGKAIVANYNDKTVKEKSKQLKKECDQKNLEEKRANGWLDIEIPIYMFPNGWTSGNDELTSVSILCHEYHSMASIKKINSDDEKYVKWLKREIKKKCAKR